MKSVSNSQPELRSATVLLVEDDLAIRDGIADLLDFAPSQFEITTFEASDGRAAVELLSTHIPDLIVSDISMPHMDGYGLLENVRNTPELAHIPIIFLTARSSKTEIDSGLVQGVELYLTKPFDSMELVELIETQLNKTLQLRGVRKERENLMKRELSRTLQHELRTPLALVTAYLEFLDMGVDSELADGTTDPEEIQEYLRGIDVGIHRLMRLVSDIVAALDVRSGRALTRIRAEADVVHDAAAILYEALEEAKRREEHQKITFDVDLPDDLPALFGHRDYLLDSFVRLFENAIKFLRQNDMGRVRVSAETIQDPQTKHESIKFTITDNGIGFPNHVRFRLTDLFYQHDREQWEQQGPGVGLSIVKGLVEAHNGYLSMSGAPWEGATVSVTLPTHKPGDSKPELGTAPEQKRRATVLLVEDDLYAREVLVDMIKVFNATYSYDVQVATNGLEALEIMGRIVPDIIISDIQMPQMDGIEMLELIRQNPGWLEIPVIFLTGNRTPEQVHRGRVLGVDDYIPKPYKPRFLLDRMTVLLERRFEKQAAESGNFDSLKERILDSVEVGIVDALTQMTNQSQTMRDLMTEEASPKDSDNIDELRRSLIGIQKNSANISGMVRNATMLVDIRTGTAESGFKLRAGMVESVADVLDSAVRNMREQADFDSTANSLSNVSIVLPERAMTPPVYGDVRMMEVAFIHWLSALSHGSANSPNNEIVVEQLVVGDNIQLKGQVADCAIDATLLSDMQAVLSDEGATSTLQADLTIFREYMLLHSAELTLDLIDGNLISTITFPPFDLDLL